MRINKNILNVNQENDIKYRGPITYRYLRIFAWIGLAVGQIAVLLSFAYMIFAEVNSSVGGLDIASKILNSFSLLSTPFFLLANFAVVFNSRNNFKKLLIFYSLALLGVYAAFLFFYSHYLFTFLNHFLQDTTKATYYENLLVKKLLKDHASFNIFVDLLLWILFYFFLSYHPKKYFQGKKIYIFRSFIAFPILYEIMTIFLKGMDGILFNIPPYIYPLVCTKPLMLFLSFIAICLFIKRREKIFIKNGKTVDDYDAFLKTNTASLHFSIFTSIVFAIASFIDLIFVVIFAVVPNFTSSSFGQFLVSIGLGQCYTLIGIIPFVMLFSYNRTHSEKTKMVDIIIPIAGLLLIVLSILETALQLFVHLT